MRVRGPSLMAHAIASPAAKETGAAWRDSHLGVAPVPCLQVESEPMQGHLVADVEKAGWKPF